jgi:cytochrome oxidase assembly protein ShyY1
MSMRWPLIPTLLVAAAVATMIALGIWQLRRADEKAG